MAKPKNPVRAARQAGRQQIRAAKQQVKSYKDEKKVTAKLAKIDTKISKKLEKIEKKLPPSQPMVGKDTGRVTGEAKPIGFKSVADKYKLQTPAPKSAPKTAPKTAPKSGGSKGGSNTNFEDKRKETEKRFNAEKKDPDIKLSEYAELQRQYDEKKSKEQRTPAEIAEQKRIAIIKANAFYANSREKARLKRLEEERIAKEKGKSGSSSNNNSSSGSSKPTFDMRFLDMGPKYKKGGSVRKYQYGGNPTRPPQPARPQLARPATRGTGPLPPQPAPAQRPSVRPRAVPPPRPRLGASKKGGAVKSKVSKTKKGK